MIELLPIILIDTGEQCPLVLPTLPCEWANIEKKSGVDYGIKGFTVAKPPDTEDLTRRYLLPNAGVLEKEERTRRAFAITRKSLGDLCSSMGKGHDEFEAQVEIMSRYKFRALVIESTRNMVEMEAYRSDIKASSVLHGLDAFAVRMGLHVIWCGDAKGAAERVETLARMFVRGIEKDYRTLVRYTLAAAPRTKGALLDKEA